MAINPGILPLAITRGIELNELVLQCKDENVAVTGTLNPNVVGDYVPSGNYNGYPLFILEGSPSTFLYVNPIAASYVIARLLTDGALTDYWSPASPLLDDPTGTYAPHGANTGTATADDNPTDLTGFTAQAEGRRSAGAEELIVDFNPSITNAAAGEITIPALTKDETKALPYVLNAVWDLVLINGSGERVQVALRGPLSISDNVSQEP